MFGIYSLKYQKVELLNRDGHKVGHIYILYKCGDF